MIDDIRGSVSLSISSPATAAQCACTCGCNCTCGCFCGVFWVNKTSNFTPAANNNLVSPANSRYNTNFTHGQGP
jgi:hypothetical protein